MKKVIIIGSGGHAKVCIDILERMNGYIAEGLLDDFRNAGEDTMGVPVLGKIIDADRYIDRLFFIAVGDNYSRLQIQYKLSNLNLKYINLIDPSAVVGTTLNGSEGVVVMPGAIVNAGSYIGSHTIINTGATLDHDNVLMDFASVGPGVHTGGHVHIGKCTHIGIGATISNTVTIGEHSVVGAGSLALSFIASYKLAYGSPCKEIRDRSKDDKYL